jgi:hypothetical protein
MREPGRAVGRWQRASHDEWSWRKMRPWPAGAHESDADGEGNA